MASRSLILNLNVDRPDPENRTFVHADPFAWTQANRPKIVRAFYTLLIAGALSRPEGQEAKTRFKTWWRLVGWSIEHAAGLLGISIDCTELMRAGEVDDEEATGASSALAALMQVFGDREFTSRDVVSAMTPEHLLGGSDEEQQAARQIAERLSDALAELVGKSLDRPTARSIGKLFQKRLVGRPAWIEDGRRVATLRRIPRHGENLYRIEVTDNSPGQSENVS